MKKFPVAAPACYHRLADVRRRHSRLTRLFLVGLGGLVFLRACSAPSEKPDVERYYDVTPTGRQYPTPLLGPRFYPWTRATFPGGTMPEGHRNIFDIEGELLQLVETFDALEEGGDDPEILRSIEDYVGKLLEEREAKVDAYTSLIKAFEARGKILRAEADTYREELERLTGKAKAYENRSKRLKEWAKVFMQAIGATRLEGKFSLLRIQVNGTSALVLDPELDASTLPKRFIKIKRDVDTDAIRKALEFGEELPYAHLERGTHVRVGTP